ncbi:MAG: hypothetical protein LC769_03990 [Chloroflexi bacterium]|nr:hypothetical protein [Chloroflexota bacterium]
MERRNFEQRWHHLSAEIMAGISDWRFQHPNATLRELETELDARLARMRARMLEDLALASAATDWHDQTATAPPACPQCGSPVEPRGLHARTLQTHGGQSLTLERRYGVCPVCETGLFPPR